MKIKRGPKDEKNWKKAKKELFDTIKKESVDFQKKFPSETPTQWIRRKGNEYKGRLKKTKKKDAYVPSSKEGRDMRKKFDKIARKY